MDKASDFGSEDCRFESCRGRLFCLFFVSVYNNCKIFDTMLYNKPLHKNEILLNVIVFILVLLFLKIHFNQTKVFIA